MKLSVNKFSWPIINIGGAWNVRSTKSELRHKLRTVKLEKNMGDSSLSLSPSGYDHLIVPIYKMYSERTTEYPLT